MSVVFVELEELFLGNQTVFVLVGLPQQKVHVLFSLLFGDASLLCCHLVGHLNQLLPA